MASSPPPLLKQASLRPASYPERGNIGSDVYDWCDPQYRPVEFTEPFIVASKKPEWADPPNVSFLEMLTRTTINREGVVTKLPLCTLYDFTEGRFLNPRGKTGISGRGMLGRWGPNWAADVIVTKREGGKLWVLLCEKQVGDGTSTLCFPAGMVEPGQFVPETLRRELCEEAVNDDTVVDELFRMCNMGCVYAGHVDDWRNTDHAWIVTQAYRFHATPEIAAKLTLNVTDTDEIKKSAWYVATDVTEMYASHKAWLDKVVASEVGKQNGNNRPRSVE